MSVKIKEATKQNDKINDDTLVIELAEGAVELLGQKSGLQIKQETMKSLHQDLRQQIEDTIQATEKQAYDYLDQRFTQFRKKSAWKISTHKDTKLLNVDFELELLYSCFEEKEFSHLVHKRVINYLQCKLDDVHSNKGTKILKPECQIQEHTCGPINCPLSHKTSRTFKFPNVMLYRKHMVDFHRLAFMDYQCPLCDFGASVTQTDFLNHIKDRHQTLMCLCKKSFITQLQLSIHVRQCLSYFKEVRTVNGITIDDGRDPTCNLCPMVIRRKNLVQHMLDLHSMTLKSITCCICMESCTDVEQFVQHMKTQHIMIKCTCLKQFTNFEKFSEHASRCVYHYKSTGNTMTID